MISMMFRRLLPLCLLSISMFLLSGCQGKPPQPEQTTADMTLTMVKSMLQAYIDGTPRGSEEENYDMFVTSIREAYPEKADVLQKGLADLKRLPASSPSLKSTAKRILDQL